MEIRKSYPEEETAVLKLLETVFSTTGGPADFRSWMPKAYQPGRMPAHWTAAERGRLWGAALALEVPYQYQNKSLNGVGIGSVAVHPEARGKGLMSQLIRSILQEAAEHNADFCFLEGERQRYSHFGFEKGGLCHQLRLLRKDLGESQGITAYPLDSEDQETLKMLSAVRRTCPLASVTPAALPLHLKSWRSLPLALFDQTQCLGYAVLSGDQSQVRELILKPGISRMAAASALFQYTDREELCFTLRHWEEESWNTLETVADSRSWIEDRSFLFLRPDRVLEYLMTMENDRRPLPPGQYLIQIDAEKLKLSVGRDVQVSRLQSADLSPCPLVLTSAQLIRGRLAEPAEVLLETELIKRILPLPLALLDSDGI